MAQKITSYQTAEYGKFVEIVDNTEYPPVSVVRISYPDNTSAFPSNSALGPLSSVEVYPKYAILTKLINADEIKVSLSAGDINVNLDEIEVNTDEIEKFITESNYVLSSIRFDMNSQFDETQTILLNLTSIQNTKQDNVITLLNQLTANTDDVENLITTSNTKLDVLTGVDYATSLKQEKTNTLLDSITAANVNVPGFKIPPYDEIDMSYAGSTNNIETVVYKNNSTTVFSLSFVYVTNPPTVDNALLKTVKKL